MGDYFEDWQAKEIEKAVEKAQKKEHENMALKLIRLGKISLEDIANVCGLTLRRVKTLAKLCNSEAVVTS